MTEFTNKTMFVSSTQKPLNCSLIEFEIKLQFKNKVNVRE